MSNKMKKAAAQHCGDSKIKQSGAHQREPYKTTIVSHLQMLLIVLLPYQTQCCAKQNFQS